MTRIVSSLCIFLVLATSVSARNRILGGTAIPIDQAPFAAAFSTILSSGASMFHTGGVVLTSRHILSAAHSFLRPTQIYYVRLGSTFWQTGGVSVLVQTAINHPDYNHNTVDSDVTVVVLSEPVPIGGSTGIANAILPHPSTVLPDNMPISVAGWGATENFTPSAHLLNIDVFVINWELCRQRYEGFSITPTVNMFCAGILDVSGIDACSGDSGGPAYSGEVVYGLVSWGDGCGNAYRPGVYVTLPNFIDWIQTTVNTS